MLFIFQDSNSESFSQNKKPKILIKVLFQSKYSKGFYILHLCCSFIINHNIIFEIKKLESVIGEYDVFGISPVISFVLPVFPVFPALPCLCGSSQLCTLALCFLSQSAPFFFSVSSPHPLHLSQSLQLHLVLLRSAPLTSCHFMF